MATERRKQLLIGAVVVVLALVTVWLWPGTSAAPAPTSNKGARTAGANTAAPPPPPLAQAGAASLTAVHLETLNGDRPKPKAGERNLFRFKPKPPPPPPPPEPSRPVVPVNPAPTGPPPPPPVPPIGLKFIGVVETTLHAQKIAVLSDGRNPPFYGKEGDIIEGRYRILKIGVESVEIAYTDGRGRQTIRLGS